MGLMLITKINKIPKETGSSEHHKTQVSNTCQQITVSSVRLYRDELVSNVRARK